MQPNPQQKKKARMLTSDVSNRIQPVRFVPSSQSDEELPAMDSEPDVGPISCRESSITDDESNHLMDMDVDEDKTEAQEAARGSWSPSNELSSRTEAQTPDLFSTPPSSDAPPMPPTPVALDAASKTAKIIADIKARALAKSMSSPEPALPEFIEELESSSDEEGILSVLPVTRIPVTRKNLPRSAHVDSGHSVSLICYIFMTSVSRRRNHKSQSNRLLDMRCETVLQLPRPEAQGLEHPVVRCQLTSSLRGPQRRVPERNLSHLQIHSLHC